jgi:hypothetical protein
MCSGTNQYGDDESFPALENGSTSTSGGGGTNVLNWLDTLLKRAPNIISSVKGNPYATQPGAGYMPPYQGQYPPVSTGGIGTIGYVGIGVVVIVFVMLLRRK